MYTYDADPNPYKDFLEIDFSPFYQGPIIFAKNPTKNSFNACFTAVFDPKNGRGGVISAYKYKNPGSVALLNNDQKFSMNVVSCIGKLISTGFFSEDSVDFPMCRYFFTIKEQPLPLTEEDQANESRSENPGL